MYYCIERSTDSRYLRTEIRKTKSKVQALKWLKEKDEFGELLHGRFAFPDLADPSIAPSQQNYHKRLRSILRSPYCWRSPSKGTLQKMARQASTRCCEWREQDVIYTLLLKVGKEVKE